MGLFEQVQQIAQKPATGVSVGSGTVAFGWLSDLASTAEQIGMIAGCILTVGLLYDFLSKKWKLWRAKS